MLDAAMAIARVFTSSLPRLFHSSLISLHARLLLLQVVLMLRPHQCDYRTRAMCQKQRV